MHLPSSKAWGKTSKDGTALPPKAKGLSVPQTTESEQQDVLPRRPKPKGLSIPQTTEDEQSILPRKPKPKGLSIPAGEQGVLPSGPKPPKGLFTPLGEQAVLARRPKAKGSIPVTVLTTLAEEEVK